MFTIRAGLCRDSTIGACPDRMEEMKAIQNRQEEGEKRQQAEATAAKAMPYANLSVNVTIN